MNAWAVETGKSLPDRIRAFVEAHPRCTSTTCAQKLRVTRTIANQRMLCMSYDGILVASGNGLTRSYTLGRELKKRKDLPDSVAASRRRERKNAYDRAVRAEARKLREIAGEPIRKFTPRQAAELAPKSRCSSYAEWLERCGVPDEVLPGSEYRMPRPLPVREVYPGARAHG